MMDDLWRRHRSEKFNETPERKVEEGERNLGLGRIEISDREGGKPKLDQVSCLRPCSWSRGNCSPEEA